MAYGGTVELVDGIKPKNNGTWPLVNAHDVYVDDENRLDDALSGIDDKVDEALDNAVRVDKAQTFTDAQKAQALENIGGASISDISSFVEYDIASECIKNVKIYGSYADIMISNLRNAYIPTGESAAQTGFTIYLTNSTGTDTTNPICNVTDLSSNKGSFKRILSDGRLYTFDYDLSLIPSGSRNTHSGLTHLISPLCFYDIQQDYVSYSIKQNLNDSEKSLARSNINCADNDEVENILTDLIWENAKNILTGHLPASSTINGVTFEVFEGAIRISGTASSSANFQIYNNAVSIPDWIVLGQEYYSSLQPSYEIINTIALQVLYYTEESGANPIVATSTIGDHNFVIPTNAIGLIIRIHLDKDRTANGLYRPYIGINRTSAMNTALMLSDFELIGHADNVIKNVNVYGEYFNLYISNIRNNYNGVTGFTLYKDDSSNVLLNVINISTVGHFSAEVLDGTLISFDYDLTSLASGGKMQAFNDGYKVKKSVFKPEIKTKRLYYTDYGFVNKFGIIGDSYSSGEVYIPADNERGYTAEDYYDVSWGQILARKNGATCINFSVGGLTTKTWLTDSHGLSLLQSSPNQTVYICALGINDLIKYGTSYIGSRSDINNDPSLNADSFYGNYGKIISNIKQQSPLSKIIMMTFAYNYSANEDAFNAAILDIANYFSIPSINIKKHDYFSETSIYHTGKKWNHPTAPLYAGMAEAINELLSECIYKNYEYFSSCVNDVT